VGKSNSIRDWKQDRLTITVLALSFPESLATMGVVAFPSMHQLRRISNLRSTLRVEKGQPVWAGRVSAKLFGGLGKSVKRAFSEEITANSDVNMRM
jgi:hypothetical protein